MSKKYYSCARGCKTLPGTVCNSSPKMPDRSLLLLENFYYNIQNKFLPVLAKRQNFGSPLASLLLSGPGSPRGSLVGWVLVGGWCIDHFTIIVVGSSGGLLSDAYRYMYDHVVFCSCGTLLSVGEWVCWRKFTICWIGILLEMDHWKCHCIYLWIVKDSNFLLEGVAPP